MALVRRTPTLLFVQSVEKRTNFREITGGGTQSAFRDQKPGGAASLHRMLLARGNPTMDNLAAIFDAVGGKLRAESKVAVCAA